MVVDSEPRSIINENACFLSQSSVKFVGKIFSQVVVLYPCKGINEKYCGQISGEICGKDIFSMKSSFLSLGYAMGCLALSVEMKGIECRNSDVGKESQQRMLLIDVDGGWWMVDGG
ncbi:hypothetical protein VNO78_17918 [Psophocarpus tetragonolobus]|uniref:Uncharacterized protein n=1 Tax=Psophocarpus tetragonolobus TaxID=3891 RepID=A0AAN9SK03_PSOTE